MGGREVAIEGAVHSMGELPLTPGIHRLVQSTSGARLALSVPVDFSKGANVPLVLALHWGIEIYPHISADFLGGLVHPGLEELGAVIVAPDRVGGSWANPESEKRVIELLQFVGREYGMDQHEAIIMGYSMGGLGCWFIGQRRQDLFKAMIPMASVPPKEFAESEFDIPIYVIHGRADEVFPCDETQSIVRELRGRGGRVAMCIVEDATHYEVGSYINALKQAIPWIRECLDTD